MDNRSELCCERLKIADRAGRDPLNQNCASNPYRIQIRDLMLRTLEFFDLFFARVLVWFSTLSLAQWICLGLVIAAIVYIGTFVPSDGPFPIYTTKTHLGSVRSILKFDPATRNVVEALLCMPGLHAVWVHRIAHVLYRLGIPLVPRVMNYVSRFLFGIDIHPGAQLGKGVVVDHALGTVIGETAVVGDYCLIYQEVTLGGTGKSTSFKRHPTVGSHVVIGCGAKVLGPIKIGNHVRIGAGSGLVLLIAATGVLTGRYSRDPGCS